jgi:hypothetical protein
VPPAAVVPTSSSPAGIFKPSWINQASKTPFFSFVQFLRNDFFSFFFQQKGAKGSFNTSRPFLLCKSELFEKVQLCRSERR